MFAHMFDLLMCHTCIMGAMKLFHRVDAKRTMPITSDSRDRGGQATTGQSDVLGSPADGSPGSKRTTMPCMGAYHGAHMLCSVFWC